MLWGYVSAWMKGARQLDDPELRAFIRAFQRRALRVGKARAVAEIEAATDHPRGSAGRSALRDSA
jgi:hypothetical protein